MIGGVTAGRDSPVRIMGIINASPESFHKSSIREGGAEAASAAASMMEHGAHYIDVGGMSTAPYLDTWVPEAREQERVVAAISAIRESCDIPISVDTCRSSVAAAAMDAGATILNDVTGLGYDPNMQRVISKYDPSVILCAQGWGVRHGSAADTALILDDMISRAASYGADRARMAVDPAIGFFRDTGREGLYTKIRGDWNRRDANLLMQLRDMGRELPVLVSVSNKSFIGHILDGRESPFRIFGSIAAEALAVAGGADIIRTHNVAESRDAIRVASAVIGRPDGYI